MRRGYVFNTQRFSVHDGPGIRTTVFLKGCPLSCTWCHNPEGIAPGPELALSPRRCIECGECVAVCPQGLAVAGGIQTTTAPDLCLACGACAEICPSQARQIAGLEKSVSEVVAEVLRDRVFFEESGGGVTFSGGEPLWQSGFLYELLKACRYQGIHTAVDTSGLAPWEDLARVASVTDLFLFDVKHMDDEIHRQVTGVSNTRILANLRRLGEIHRHIWIRVPVVPGINDSVENLRATGRLAASLEGVEKICLLPYHPLGVDKLRRQGLGSVLEDVERPTDVQMQQLARLVETTGVTTGLGG